MAEVLNLGIGAGTNSSEVFDLNTPNPFAISQDYMNKAIAMREKSLARDVENEKERQERLDDFLSKIDNVDPKWANANLELNSEINKYGDQIAEYRAQGKPLTKEFYKQINQAQRAIKDKAAINEKNFNKYSQIMAEMSAHPELYSKEDIDAFENQITKAYEKEDGGIMAAEPILSSWQKIIGPINVVESYIKGNFLPQSKDKTGYLKATDEKDFKNSINSYWDSLTMPQRKKIYDQYVRDGRIDADKVAGVEGQVDQDVMKKLIEEDVRPKMEYDKTPVSYSGGSRGSSEDKNAVAFQDQAKTGEDTLWKITLSKGKTGAPPEASYFRVPWSNKDILMTPSKMVYVTAAEAGDGKEGWYVVGAQQMDKGSKAIGVDESEQQAINSYAAANKINASGLQARQEDGVWKFYTVNQVWAPYEDNIARMRGYGLDDLEGYAKKRGYRGLRGPLKTGSVSEETTTEESTNSAGKAATWNKKTATPKK